MSAAPGRMMMAWVWISVVTLARFNTATGTHQDSDGGPTVLGALLSDSELPVGTRSEGGFFPVPVWKFLKEHGDDGGDEDFGRPQFRCSNSSLSVRFSLIRHSDLRLLDGKKLLPLPDGCNGSVRTSRPWLLLNVSYSGCHVALQISNGTWLHRLTVRYFDSLLQTNVTGVATCVNPATRLRSAPPLVICRPTDVIVKLPLGARLKRVSALGKDDVVGRVLTKATPTSMFVQISTPANMDSILEMAYDSAGETSTMLVACLNAVTKSRLTPRQSAGGEPDPTGNPSSALTTPVVPQVRAVVTIPVPLAAFDQIENLWGFEEIPDGPFTTSATAGSTATNPTSPTAVPSTAAPNP